MSAPHRPIRRIFVHHSAGREDATLEDIRRAHLARGFRDVGYHFVVRTSGQVEGGRPTWQVGAHVAGANADSVGVCAIGSRHIRPCPPEQWAALVDLVAALAASWPEATIEGHGEHARTQCPGAHLDMDQLRAEVSQRLGRGASS